MDQNARTSNPLIRKLEGFASLSDADRGLLERVSASARPIAAGTDLAREGEPPDGVYLIMDGMACRHKRSASGARQIMAYLVPGDLCDLDVALLDQMEHNITTLSDCSVVRITPEVVANLLEHHPAVARALRKSTLVDEATLREWLVNVGCRSADERIAHLLCELLLRLQVVGKATHDSFDLPVTQQDLADTTGLSSVHVNRTMQSLQRQEVIALAGTSLQILDLPRLKALAGFKPNYLHLGDRAAA
jgi:CRP-like cAMP-binding protein